MAQQLDHGNGREVASVLHNIYQTDRHAFSQLAQQINRNEQNYRGDDLTITENGQVYVGHRGRQERVGQIDNARNYGQGNWNYPNGGMGDHNRHNNGRNRIDIDIDIDVSPAPYPRNGDRSNGRYGYPNEPIYRPLPPNSRHPEPIYYPDRDWDNGYGRSRQPDYRHNDRIPNVHRGSSNGNEGEVFGTIIGGVAGGVIGHQRDRDDTLTGALIGALGGNIIGRQIDNNNNRQRDFRWHR